MDILDSFLPSKILRYVLIATVIALAVFVQHQLAHPLWKYPAPNFFVTIPYLGEIWFAWLTLKGNPDVTLRQLHAKLGKVVRIGPNEVSIDDSEAVKDLYGHGNDIEKANHYWAFVAFKWTMFSSMVYPWEVLMTE
jgi:benzoate 4-monooxygenase